jgi:hypothetical protein
MKTDTALRRTRNARHVISASVADDPAKLVEYYIALQKHFGARLQPGPCEALEDGRLAEQQQNRAGAPSELKQDSQRH